MLGAAEAAAVSDGSAAFLVPELASGVDRNGDGDADAHWAQAEAEVLRRSLVGNGSDDAWT